MQARIESARRASILHKKRTGKALKITPEDVENEAMYEEEDTVEEINPLLSHWPFREFITDPASQQQAIPLVNPYLYFRSSQQLGDPYQTSALEHPNISGPASYEQLKELRNHQPITSDTLSSDALRAARLSSPLTSPVPSLAPHQQAPLQPASSIFRNSRLIDSNLGATPLETPISWTFDNRTNDMLRRDSLNNFSNSSLERKSTQDLESFEQENELFKQLQMSLRSMQHETPTVDPKDVLIESKGAENEYLKYKDVAGSSPFHESNTRLGKQRAKDNKRQFHERSSTASQASNESEHRSYFDVFDVPDSVEPLMDKLSDQSHHSGKAGNETHITRTWSLPALNDSDANKESWRDFVCFDSFDDI